MKKIFLRLGFLFILVTGYSQNMDYQKNEISIGLINFTESPDNQEVLFKNSFYLTPFSNLTYKRFFDQNNALRFIFFRPIHKSYKHRNGELFDEGDYNEQVLKIGYEHIFTQKKLSPYIAVDLVYLNSSSSKTEGGGITGSTLKSEENKKGIGVAPTAGISYQIYKNVYIGLESSVNIIHVKNEKISTQLLPETSESPAKETSNSFEYIFNPANFLVKIKF